MFNYELTERGKIIIAVVLVAVLLVLSSIVLSIGTCSGSSPPDDPPQSSEPSPGEDPTLSNTPLPTPGSGFDPPSIPATPKPTPTPTPTPTPSQPPHGNGNGNGYGHDMPEFGPVGLNITEGTMQFIFSPSLQETLDEDTVAMLSDFLTSPKNTDDAKVQVEMPNLTEEDTAILLTAVTKAFSTYKLTVDDIVYLKNQNEVSESSFEVMLSYYVATNLK